MTSILDKIIANKRKEVEKNKSILSFGTLAKQLVDTPARASFKQAIAKSDTGIIAEFKRRSPSKGWIFENATINDIIPAYTLAGASAISVLTDTDFFGGTMTDLKDAVAQTNTPLLRKDFMVDEYQIYEAKIWGASAILLIASALSIDETKRFAAIAKELRLDVLLEIHNEQELNHINEFVDVVGVNNRNLSSFVTDVQVSFDLVNKIPDEFIKISESGLSSPQTVLDLQQVGYKGFLMGENFMKTSNPGKALAEFIAELRV